MVSLSVFAIYYFHSSIASHYFSATLELYTSYMTTTSVVPFRFICRYITLVVTVTAALVVLHYASIQSLGYRGLSYRVETGYHLAPENYGDLTTKSVKVSVEVDQTLLKNSATLEDKTKLSSEEEDDPFQYNFILNSKQDLKELPKHIAGRTRPMLKFFKKSAPSNIEILIPTTTNSGFVTSLEFWDQQTNSIQNILSLQAFAAWLDVAVLEPFLVETKFGLPLHDEKAFHPNGSVLYLTFSDLYDLKRYNNDIRSYLDKANPLTPWKTFFETAARDVVFINVNGMSPLYQKSAQLSKTLTKLGFRIVRENIIILNGSTESISETDLKMQVYNDLQPSEVTVIFNVWNRQDFPYVFADHYLDMVTRNSIISLKPSRRLHKDAMKYKLKHMRPVNDNYIGILVRAEWVMLIEGKLRKDSLQSCLQKSLDRFREVTTAKGILNVFVGMDIGKYGSKTMEDLNVDHITSLGVNFLRSAYNNSQMTLESWENTFTDISSSSVPGYIANLEKLIAAQGRCLMLIGYGSFQSSALKMYVERHLDTCVLRTDMSCNLTYNDVY